ncbi:MAG: hypothetical protein NTV87_13275 [Ignavibacteriae bacterium]|nr:hypothetical protein [Ignavibacteriota bacterium]
MNKKKHISIFYSLLALLFLSGIIVFYINNIINVNKLIFANNELKENISKTAQSNNQYQIEIEKLTTFEKIRKIAEEKFGLKISDSSVIDRKILTIKKSER